MISLNYFKYLIKSKLALILVVILSTFLFTLNSSDEINYVLIIYTFFLSFILPFIFLSFISNHKAIDTYYSLPISRNKLLFTNIITMILTLFVSYTVGFITYIIRSDETFNLIYLLVVLLCIILMIVYNSLLYLLGNKRIDSIILTGAYTVLPFALLAVCQGFASTYIAGIGYGSGVFDFFYYLSPIGLTIETLFRNINYIELIDVVFIFIHLAIYLPLLIHSFNYRNTERVNSITDHKLGYKLIIPLYATLTVLLRCSMYTYDTNISSFLIDSLVSFIAILLLVISANFIYKRKFTISIKDISVYMVIILLSLGITCLFRDTNGFNIAYSIDVNENSTYLLEIYDCDNKEIINYLSEETGKDISEYNITIKENSNAEDIIEIRNNMIKDFYEPGEEKDCYSYLTINTDNKVFEYSSNNNYLTLDSLLTIANHSTINITIFDDHESFEYVIVNNKLIEN